MPLPLHTDRLVIRPLTAADAADVFALYGDPHVLRFWNSGPLADLAEAREWAVEQGAAHAERGFAQWHVSERSGGRFIGCVGLQPLGDEVELLYALMPDSWGRGFATEAGWAALEYGFDEAGLERVAGIALEVNQPSVRVLQRLGMRSLGAADYWSRSWAKYEWTVAAWRAEREAARPPLITERLEARPFTDGDLTPLLTVFGDPEVMRYVGATGRALDAGQLVASQVRVREHWDQHGFGPLAVVEQASGRVVGEAGLQVLEGGPDVELTYTLARAAWGRGYATEAARAILVWGFAGLRLRRIVAVVYPGNAASRHVLEKLAMAPQGTRVCYGAVLAEYALTLGEWRAGGSDGPPARLYSRE